LRAADRRAAGASRRTVLREARGGNVGHDHATNGQAREGGGGMSETDTDDLFDEGDPFDHPAWREAAKKTKTAGEVADFVGCPLRWLGQVLPHVQGECQLTVALLLYRRWVLCGRRRVFDFPNWDLKKLGIDRSVKHRTLANLKAAGLIGIEQRAGR